MNASVVTVYAYKGRAIFLSVIDNCTNFADGSDLNVVSLFFFAREPGGNLALRCVSPLQELHSATQGHLPALLNFVRDTGKRKFFVPFFTRLSIYYRSERVFVLPPRGSA